LSFVRDEGRRYAEGRRHKKLGQKSQENGVTPARLRRCASFLAAWPPLPSSAFCFCLLPSGHSLRIKSKIAKVMRFAENDA
jgi:hypothetical protein